MTNFVDGYGPQSLTGQVNVYLDGPPHIEENYTITVSFGGQTNEDTKDAVTAGLVAISDSILAAYPTATVNTSLGLSGGKSL